MLSSRFKLRFVGPALVAVPWRADKPQPYKTCDNTLESYGNRARNVPTLVNTASIKNVAALGQNVTALAQNVAALVQNVAAPIKARFGLAFFHP